MTSGGARLESIEHDIDETRTRIDHTLDALAEKVSASRLAGEALDSVRQNGGMFAGNLVHTARDNPVATILVATGLAWLMVSDRRGHAAGDRFSAASPSAPDHSTPAAPGHPVAGAARASAVASSAAQAVGDGAHNAGEAARGAANRLGEAATRAKVAAGDTAASMYAAAHDLRDSAVAAGHEGGRRAADIYAGARDVTRRAGGFLADNPLMIGALGLAIGGIVAAALPSTRREDEWVGEAGDHARREAAEVARSVAREGARVAEAAVDPAKAEAKRQDLTPDDARQKAGKVAGQAVRGGAEIAKSAVRAGEDETRRRTGNGAPQSH